MLWSLFQSHMVFSEVPLQFNARAFKREANRQEHSCSCIIPVTIENQPDRFMSKTALEVFVLLTADRLMAG